MQFFVAFRPNKVEEIIVKASPLAMTGLFAKAKPKLAKTGEEIEGKHFLLRLYKYKPPCFSKI